MLHELRRRGAAIKRRQLLQVVTFNERDQALLNSWLLGYRSAVTQCRTSDGLAYGELRGDTQDRTKGSATSFRSQLAVARSGHLVVRNLSPSAQRRRP